MTPNFRVRFFAVDRVDQASPAFSDILEQLSQASQTAGWVPVEDYAVRLERLDRTGALITGDLVRQQIRDLPPFADAGGHLTPNDRPLGHRSAFIYDTVRSVIGLEARQAGVSHARLVKFGKAVTDYRYNIFAALKSDHLARLARGIPLKMHLRVAQPHDLELVADEDTSRLGRSLQSMQDTFGGPVLEITMGFGRTREREEHLAHERVRRLIQNLLPFRRTDHQEGSTRVEALQVFLEGETEPVDFLKGQISYEAEVELDENDLHRHYGQRLEEMRNAYRECQPELEAYRTA